LQGDLQELNKKIIPIIFLILILFAGIIALTQELDFFDFGFDEEELYDYSAEWVKQHPRWFRSNIAGMALEEIHTRFIALRNEYALSIVFAHHNEIPDYLFPYYEEYFFSEVRTLYQNGMQIRTQWLFRDINGYTRMNALFIEPDSSNESSGRINNRTGFVEIFNEESLLTSEYRFFKDGGITRIDYEFNEGLLISSTVSVWEDGENYSRLYTDFYWYNRSLSLRSIERVFYRNMQLNLNDPVLISFPRRVMPDGENNNLFVTERHNIYPDFFGEISIQENTRINYQTDERGRVLTQNHYDAEGNILWVIHNTWLNNRIVSTMKIEGDLTLLSEYEYNSAGDRILERNFRNGVLERLVRAEGNIEIEELYMNNTVVLRAIWEDGVKVSETRVRD
jgi:hypothetical protein